MSIALARRYRPRRFEDLLVQDHVAAALRGAVARNRVGHGYLLTGPRGVGKTTAARILAMALNCDRRDPEHPTGEPCGECDSCLRIWNGAASLDVVEIDAASNRGVDDARDLRERAMYAASQAGHHKIYIVDEAHMLTREAWNALLKILEEPPPGVVFVFATTEPQKIANAAAPVMSRLQRFDFRRIGPVAIRTRLRQVLDQEKIQADDDALLLIARHADGGMRDALSMLDQCLSWGEGPVTAARVREMLGLLDDEVFAEALRLVANREPRAVFPLLDRIVDAGSDLAEFAGGLAELLRALILHHYGSRMEGLPESLTRVVTEAAEHIGPEDAVRMLKLLGESETTLRRAPNPRLVLEVLLLRWAMLDRVVDLRALLAGRPLPPLTPMASPSSSFPGTGGPPGSSSPQPPPIPTVEQGDARPDQRLVNNDHAAAIAVPRTNEAVRAVWADIIAQVSSRNGLLGMGLEMARPTLEGSNLVLTLPGGTVYQEGLETQRELLEEVVNHRLGGTPLRIQVVVEASQAQVRRGSLSAADIRAEQLSNYCRTDPVLGAAVESLDLELLDGA